MNLALSIFFKKKRLTKLGIVKDLQLYVLSLADKQASFSLQYNSRKP